MKREYALIDNEGKLLVSSNEHGYGSYISLLTREEAKKEIEIYYRNKGYSIKKMKV